MKNALMVSWLLVGLGFPGQAALSAPDWNAVQSWVYQLQGYPGGRLDELAEAETDLVVIDLARDGGRGFFSREEIAALKESGKIVLAYFEIGAIEIYRPEWESVEEDLKAGPVQGWPQERYVRYWDERWWPVVKGRLEQALAAGFDGAYLDLVTAYEEIPGTDLELEERARRMVDLIVRLSEFAKARNPDFKIVPQNAPELATWSYWKPKLNRRYLDAIDGIGLESVFYLAHDQPAQAGWCEENRANAVVISQQGKLVLGVDYAKDPKAVEEAYRKQRELGFVPYATVVELDRVQEGPVKK
jgi:cysteinyl-tRNA synthetase